MAKFARDGLVRSELNHMKSLHFNASGQLSKYKRRAYHSVYVHAEKGLFIYTPKKQMVELGLSRIVAMQP